MVFLKLLKETLFLNRQISKVLLHILLDHIDRTKIILASRVWLRSTL